MKIFRFFCNIVVFFSLFILGASTSLQAGVCENPQYSTSAKYLEVYAEHRNEAVSSTGSSYYTFYARPRHDAKIQSKAYYLDPYYNDNSSVNGQKVETSVEGNKNQSSEKAHMQIKLPTTDDIVQAMNTTGESFYRIKIKITVDKPDFSSHTYEVGLYLLPLDGTHIMIEGVCFF